MAKKTNFSLIDYNYEIFMVMILQKNITKGIILQWDKSIDNLVYVAVGYLASPHLLIPLSSLNFFLLFW